MKKRKKNPNAFPKPIGRAEAERLLRLGKTLAQGKQVNGWEFTIDGVRVNALAARSLFVAFGHTGQLIECGANEWVLGPDPEKTPAGQVIEALRTNDMPTAMRLLREMDDGRG